jgi:glycosyltransferase involved in cell wall biosynthesis
MRVVLVLKTAEGGLWVLPQIARLRSRGHEVVAVLPPGDGRLRRALDVAGVEVVGSAFDFRFRPRPSTLLALLRLRHQLKALAPDVLHYHLYASALATRLAAIGMRVPRVHMVAGPLYLESTVIRRVERLLVRLDTVLVAGSEHTAKVYRSIGRRRRLVTIPYGVDTQVFAPMPSDVRSRVRDALGVPRSAFVVIMVAYVYAPRGMVHAGAGIKGHDVLLTAWRQFHRQHPDSRLVMVGSGFDAAGEAHRRQLMHEFAVREPVSGVSWLDTVEDVREYYAAADVSVCPSLSENHGAALEASAMGVPCIVSDAGGLPETVDETAGWVVATADTPGLATALRAAHREWVDGGLRKRALAARRRAKRQFDQTTAAERLADVLESTVAIPDGRPVRIFTEARFGQDAAGQWAAMDSSNDGRLWRRYVEALPRVEVAARSLATRSTAWESLEGVDVIPLPYYVGGRQLVSRSGQVLVSVCRAAYRARLCILRVPGAVSMAAAYACQIMRKPYVVEVVGDPTDVLRAGVLGNPGRLAARVVQFLMRRAVHGAVACRYVTAGTLQRRYPPRAQVPQLSMSNVRLEDADYRVPTGRDITAPIELVTVGSLEQLYKGHDVLLLAAADLRTRGLDVRLHIVGDGRCRPSLENLAERLSIGSEVVFHGAVHDRERLRKLLDSTDLFVLPSRTEGLPRALIEAMARGMPAVASDVGGVGELLAADALVTADRPDLLASMIEQFTTDDILRRNHSMRNYQTALSYHRDRLDAVFASWLDVITQILDDQVSDGRRLKSDT